MFDKVISENQFISTILLSNIYYKLTHSLTHSLTYFNSKKMLGPAKTLLDLLNNQNQKKVNITFLSFKLHNKVT